MTAAAGAPLRWNDVAEKGGVLGIRVLVGLTTLLGRRAGRAVLWLVAAWFVLLHAGVRRTSRAYLARVGMPTTLASVYRHVRLFAHVSLDRIFMARGDFRHFAVSSHGEEHLRDAARSGQGAIVMLAHLGSFEVMRGLADVRGLPIHVLAYSGNARRIAAALRAMNPSIEARVIEIRPGDPSFVFEAEDVVRRGEILGTMGDRVGLGGKSAVAPFLGAPARFPAGPYLVAAALGCPVLVAFGLHTPPNRYDLYCEPLADRIVLPRGAAREEALAAWASRYAARVEHHCRLAPYNWFNFYDFWSTDR